MLEPITDRDPGDETDDLVEWAIREAKRRALLNTALEYVNAVRTVLDLPTLAELPKGVPARAGACPIARALSGPTTVASVGTAWLTVDARPGYDRLLRVALPENVTRFIRCFDSEAYPELLD